MSVQILKSELFVDLPTEEQELASGRLGYAGLGGYSYGLPGAGLGYGGSLGYGAYPSMGCYGVLPGALFGY